MIPALYFDITNLFHLLQTVVQRTFHTANIVSVLLQEDFKSVLGKMRYGACGAPTPAACQKWLVTPVHPRPRHAP